MAFPRWHTERRSFLLLRTYGLHARMVVCCVSGPCVCVVCVGFPNEVRGEHRVPIRRVLVLTQRGRLRLFEDATQSNVRRDVTIDAGFGVCYVLLVYSCKCYNSSLIHCQKTATWHANDTRTIVRARGRACCQVTSKKWRANMEWKKKQWGKKLGGGLGLGGNSHGMCGLWMMVDGKEHLEDSGAWTVMAMSHVPENFRLAGLCSFTLCSARVCSSPFAECAMFGCRRRGLPGG